MIDKCREILDWLSKTEQLDKICEFGGNRPDVKKYISAIRKQMSEPRNTKAPLEVIHHELQVLLPRAQQLFAPEKQIGRGPKVDNVGLIMQRLKTLASDYDPPHKPHPKYTGVMPNPDNILYWKDQYGLNIFDTKKERLREVALREYERRFHKKLNKLEVRRSEPIAET